MGAAVDKEGMNQANIRDLSNRLVQEVETVVVGKRAAVEMAVISLLCEGHLLIEDVPGVGKTTLAKALAKSIGGVFKRIQFTPDLLPGDITGSSIQTQSPSD